VAEWWTNPAEEQLRRMSDHIGDPLMDQRIAHFDGAPFGYLQSYPWQRWPGGAPQFHDMPADARAVDACIGVPALLGQGHGSAMLRLYAQALLAGGASAVVIDPDPSNERAVRSYRRAGFRDIAIRPCENGDPALVMLFVPSFQT
jgi:aminoglycoside 6'-N-acetyltransferase